MEHPRYAVLLWAVTAGSQADSLGSDETDTVALGWSVLDLSNSKVILSQVDHVKPQTVDINDNVQLSDECRECNVTEENVREARSLEQVIEEFIGLIESRHDCNHPTDFQLITDGQLHLRQVLHPEAIRHRLQLPSCFFSFFDLRKEFSRFYNAEAPNSIADVLNYLSLEADGSAEFIPRQLQNMAQIVCRMLGDGHKFAEPETILRRLEPGLCSKSETIDSGCVARARGLPWQSSDQDIANFFRGLNIVKGGVALCLTAMGRRNGEALIRFESQEHRDLALKRHRHHIGQRYIEVYRANGEDFLNVAGCNNNEAQAFLSRGGQVIVRMRGLPYDCTAKQILDFFAHSDNPIQVLNNEEGILFVKKPDGRATGDAFVLFATEEAAYRALDKHREIIGARYIELFRSSTAEVQQVLNRTMETPYLESQVPPATTSPLLGNLPQVPLMPPPWLQGPQVQMARRDCIRLRGLPYEAQVEHIVDFLGKFATNIAYQGVHMVHNAQGQPSGEAFIQMDSEQSAFLTASQRHHRYLVIDKKQRYIEVFQCSLEDMLLVLQGVQGQPTQTSPVSALAAAQTADLGWSDPFGRISALRSRIASLGPVPPLHLPPLYSKYPAVAAAAAAVASVAQNGPNRVSPTSALNRVSPLLLPSFPLPMLLSQATPPQYYATTTQQQQQQAAVAAAASLSHLVSQQNAYASLYTNTAQC